jgi:hypothetical protein
MTHSEVFFALKERIPGLDKYETEALMEIVSTLGSKGESLRQFLMEVITEKEYPTLPLIKKIAEKYSVAALFEDHIEDRFNEFRDNLFIVCEENQKRISAGKSPGLDPDKWTKNGLSMFKSTEKIAIETIGDLQAICTNLHKPGYTDYLKKIFKDSATKVSSIKYADLIRYHGSQIEYKG